MRAPDESEVRFFQLPEDGLIPVIQIQRTAYEDSGTPIRVTVSVYPADWNLFTFEAGKVPEHISES